MRQGTREWGYVCWVCAIWDGEALWVFEQLPKWVSDAKFWEGIPGRGNCKCKGLEVELLSISGEQANVAWIEPTESNGGWNQTGKLIGTQIGGQVLFLKCEAL